MRKLPDLPSTKTHNQVEIQSVDIATQVLKY